MKDLDNFLDYYENMLSEDGEMQNPGDSQSPQDENNVDPNAEPPVDVSADGSIQTPQFDNIETVERIHAIQSLNRLWDISDKLKYIPELKKEKDVLEISNIIGTISDKLDVFSTEDLISFNKEICEVMNNALKSIKNNEKKSKENIKSDDKNKTQISEMQDILAYQLFDINSDNKTSKDPVIKSDKLVNYILDISHESYINTLRSEDQTFSVFGIELNKLEAQKILEFGRNILKNKINKNDIEISKRFDYYSSPMRYNSIEDVKIIKSNPILYMKDSKVLMIRNIPTEHSILEFMALLYISYYKYEENYKSIDGDFCKNFIKFFLLDIFKLDETYINNALSYIEDDLKIKNWELLSNIESGSKKISGILSNKQNSIDSETFDVLSKIDKINEWLSLHFKENLNILEAQESFFKVYKKSILKTFKDNKLELDEYLYIADHNNLVFFDDRKILINLMRLKSII